MAVHQCVRFCEDLKLSHDLDVRQIGKYLLGIKDEGISFKHNHKKCLGCYVDVAFTAGWQQADADILENILSRTGYVIYYDDCQLLWISKLQT